MNLRIIKILLPVVFILFSIISCEKENYSPLNYFEAKMNSSALGIAPEKVYVSKGMTVIEATSTKNKTLSKLTITIKGDQKGEYKQIYDYKTGVSVTGSSLSYKVFSKETNNEPGFFISYEGKVKITDIDLSNKIVSGEYSFKVKSIPDKKIVQIIQGKFVNLKIQ